MKIPAKVKTAIKNSFKKEEWDLAALGISSEVDKIVEKVLDPLAQAMEDFLDQQDTARLTECIKAALDEFIFWIDVKNGEPVVKCCMFDEFWTQPCDYHTFDYLELKQHADETWPAVESAIDKLEEIIKQLREANKEYRNRSDEWNRKSKKS